jgi:hypothetical protein
VQQQQQPQPGAASAALGMPPLPAGQPTKQSPGAAARAARQRKRKAEPEVVDERTQRLQKRMVRGCGPERHARYQPLGDAAFTLVHLQHIVCLDTPVRLLPDSWVLSV